MKIILTRHVSFMLLLNFNQLMHQFTSICSHMTLYAATAASQVFYGDINGNINDRLVERELKMLKRIQADTGKDGAEFLPQLVDATPWEDVHSVKHVCIAAQPVVTAVLPGGPDPHE